MNSKKINQLIVAFVLVLSSAAYADIATGISEIVHGSADTAVGAVDVGVGTAEGAVYGARRSVDPDYQEWRRLRNSPDYQEYQDYLDWRDRHEALQYYEDQDEATRDKY